MWPTLVSAFIAAAVLAIVDKKLRRIWIATLFVTSGTVVVVFGYSTYMALTAGFGPS
jgi:hypothetical protein